MGVTIIKTKDRKTYRPLYHAFVDRHFAQRLPTDSPAFAEWSESPFFFSNFSLDNGDAIGSFATFVLTSEDTYKKLIGSQIREDEILPFRPGEYGLPYLYWDTFIIENRMHAVYLLKSIFGEISYCAKQWELMITHVYAIAFTKVSEKLLKRYFFVQTGTYEQNGHTYPIMISKVKDNPYLRAFIV